MSRVQSWWAGTIQDSITRIKGSRPVPELRAAVHYLLVAALIPSLAMLVARRRLSDCGWRRPKRLALRYFIVAILISAPFLVWMVYSPGIAKPYLGQLARLGFGYFALFYVVNMFTEHLFLHGIVLGMVHPTARWPAPAPVPSAGPGRRGLLRWLGMANPVADPHHRISAWLGIAPGTIIPMLISALLFGLVHLGKDSRELALAFPGGLAQAYIALRSDSWITPFIIHLATASMALGMMVLLN